jgi:hypothetical protein
MSSKQVNFNHTNIQINHTNIEFFILKKNKIQIANKKPKNYLNFKKIKFIFSFKYNFESL